MNYSDLKKKLVWFTLTFFTVLILTAYLYCGCFPWLLFIILYVFFVFYIMLSFEGKKLLDKFHFNPFAYLFLSFFTKVLVVLGFAYFLTTYFTQERKTIILILVIGYLIAAIFDFLLLANSREPTSYEN